MTAWRLAKSLETLRNQVNQRWPDRSKASDGTIGDAAHQARVSDHDPLPNGVVTAIDITHDPDSGCDAYALAEALKDSRDSRIKYIISNARICAGNAGPKPWQWRQYNGANPHNKHTHLSVVAAQIAYDNTKPWSAVDMVGGAAPVKAFDDGDDDTPTPRGWFLRHVKKILGGIGSSIGLGGLGYMTDAQTVAVLCAFVALLICAIIGGAFWLFGVDAVREWVRRQVGR